MSMKNSVLKTSLRSEIQATDSTCKGCKPNSAATKALCQKAPVIRRSATKSRTVLVACSTTLTTWCQPALPLKSWQSSIWESIVTGCQLPTTMSVKAWTMPVKVKPWRT